MAIIAEFIVHLHDDGTVTTSGFHSEPAQTDQAAQAVKDAMPDSQVDDDPWGGMNVTAERPAQSQQQGQQWPAQQPQSTPQQGYGQPVGTPPQQQPQGGPACVHGPLKVIPGGFSQRTQKAYPAFWACQGPRGQQCRLDQKQLPAIPA